MHFLIFFVQKSFSTKNYLLFAKINLTTWGPLYTCLVLFFIYIQRRGRRVFIFVAYFREKGTQLMISIMRFCPEFKISTLCADPSPPFKALICETGQKFHYDGPLHEMNFMTYHTLKPLKTDTSLRRTLSHVPVERRSVFHR